MPISKEQREKNTWNKGESESIRGYGDRLKGKYRPPGGGVARATYDQSQDMAEEGEEVPSMKAKDVSRRKKYESALMARSRAHIGE